MWDDKDSKCQCMKNNTVTTINKVGHCCREGFHMKPEHHGHCDCVEEYEKHGASGKCECLKAGLTLNKHKACCPEEM